MQEPVGERLGPFLETGGSCKAGLDIDRLLCQASFILRVQYLPEYPRKQGSEVGISKAARGARPFSLQMCTLLSIVKHYASGTDKSLPVSVMQQKQSVR